MLVAVTSHPAKPKPLPSSTSSSSATPQSPPVTPRSLRANVGVVARRQPTHLPPSPKANRSNRIAKPTVATATTTNLNSSVPSSPTSPGVTRFRVNGKVVRVAAMRHSAYYSSSDEDDSLFGSTGRPTLGRSSRRRGSNTGSGSGLSRGDSNRVPTTTNGVGRKEETPETSRVRQNPAPPTSSSTTTTNIDGSSTVSSDVGGAAVEAMLRRVQQNHDYCEQNRRDYGDYVPARMRPNVQPTSNVKRQSRQDYRNSRIIVTDDDAIRISPHREEIMTTIDSDVDYDRDNEAVYVNTEIGYTKNENSSQDYQNAVLPLKKPARVSSMIQNVVNALQVCFFEFGVEIWPS
ncbi:unnamed protein product [Caenorhabditis auriculariae]|uniref:Uncharacterized protein n=1 Tax=Caenorhabditis auriculariae TaxID=2777116 RepID=A0A8S1HU21_9PELO|nr:unnamed protein product [Caenorhabditis auriculariae]